MFSRLSLISMVWCACHSSRPFSENVKRDLPRPWQQGTGGRSRQAVALYICGTSPYGSSASLLKGLFGASANQFGSRWSKVFFTGAATPQAGWLAPGYTQTCPPSPRHARQSTRDGTSGLDISQ